MTTVYVTGERGIAPAVAFRFAAPVIAQILIEDPDAKFVTGDSPNGIERAVRFIISDPDRLTVLTRSTLDNGKYDLDTTSQDAAKIADYAVVVTLDPTSSRIMLSTDLFFKKVKLPYQGMVKENDKPKLTAEENDEFTALMSGIKFDETPPE